MIWLLDVSPLVAYLIPGHQHHRAVKEWWPGKSLGVCPITELGFLRVACAMGSSLPSARASLADFLDDEKPTFIPCDRRALDSMEIVAARKTTDIYLADLAASRGWRLATLDRGIAHQVVDVIPA